MKQTRKKKSRLGLIVVISVLFVLTFILIAAVVMFLVTQLNATNANKESLLTNTNPLTRLNVDQIDPALALASLGGFPDSEIVIEAINKERPETALAALLFATELNNIESAGDFLLLADTYAAEGQHEKAVFSYQMAGTTAALSPDIVDTTQANIFLQTAEGLIALNEPALAKLYLDQAFVIASSSPSLQAAHRRPILQQLQKDYIKIEERELARLSLDLSANPPNLDLLPEAATALPEGDGIALPKEIQEAEAERWIKAQELSALLVERGGHAPPSAVTALKIALLEEDKLKLAFFDNKLTETTQVSEKIGLTKAKIKWLSIKYRTARQAYGTSIVPEWERSATAEQIRADLTKTYESLYALYADYIVALPEVSQIDKATEERLRREVLAGELGRYPNYPEEQRQKQLLEISEQLMARQPELNIFLGLRVLAEQDFYILQAIE